MAMEEILVIGVVGAMVGVIIAALVNHKKEDQSHPCHGCPNYSSCRAHIGCANNPKNRK